MIRVVIACAIVVLSAALQAQDPSTADSSLRAGLPRGPGREAVAARCLTCHEADLIVQQRLSRAGWARELDKMIRWGAVVDATEREPMLDYLSAHFTPKPVPGQIVATAGTEMVYKRACFACHEDDLIEAQRLTRVGWMREVDKMIRWGAIVHESEKDALVEYLAARYPPR